METRPSSSSQNSCSLSLWLKDMIGKGTKAQRQNSALFCKNIYSSMQVTEKMYIGKILLSVALQLRSGLDRLTVEVSTSHTIRHTQRRACLCTRDRPVAETSTWQHATLTRHTHPRTWWDQNQQSQQASGRKPTPCTTPPPGKARIKP